MVTHHPFKVKSGDRNPLGLLVNPTAGGNMPISQPSKFNVGDVVFIIPYSLTGVVTDVHYKSNTDSWLYKVYTATKEIELSDWWTGENIDVSQRA